MLCDPVSTILLIGKCLGKGSTGSSGSKTLSMVVGRARENVRSLVVGISAGSGRRSLTDWVSRCGKGGQHICKSQCYEGWEQTSHREDTRTLGSTPIPDVYINGRPLCVRSMTVRRSMVHILQILGVFDARRVDISDSIVTKMSLNPSGRMWSGSTAAVTKNRGRTNGWGDRCRNGSMGGILS